MFRIITKPQARNRMVMAIAVIACLAGSNTTRADINVVEEFSTNVEFVKFRGLIGFHVKQEGNATKVILNLAWMKAMVAGHTVYKTPQNLYLVNATANPERLRIDTRFASQPPFHFHIKADVIPVRRMGPDIVSKVHVKVEAQAESFQGKRLGKFTLFEASQEIKHPRWADTYIDPVPGDRIEANYTIVNTTDRTVRFKMFPSNREYTLPPGDTFQGRSWDYGKRPRMLVQNTGREYTLVDGRHKFWWNNNAGRIGFDKNYR